MKKIDDKILLQRLEEGVPQKDIAKEMGASPAAISKRLKRLVPPPRSLDKLTEKEKMFAIEVASGKNAMRAAMVSHECTSLVSAKSMGHQLLKKPEIEAAIVDLMHEEGLTRRYRVRKLRQHVDNRDPSVSLKAIDMANRLDASYPPQRQVNLNANMDFPGFVDLNKYRDLPEEPLSEERKQQYAICDFLEKNPMMSDDAIAEETGADLDFIKQIKNEISSLFDKGGDLKAAIFLAKYRNF